MSDTFCATPPPWANLSADDILRDIKKLKAIDPRPDESKRRFPVSHFWPLWELRIECLGIPKLEPDSVGVDEEGHVLWVQRKHLEATVEAIRRNFDVLCMFPQCQGGPQATKTEWK